MLRSKPIIILLVVLSLFFSLPEYSLENRLLSGALLLICLIPILNYLYNPIRVPILELVLINYAAFFCLPIFFQNKLDLYSGQVVPQNSIINDVYLITILAVLSIRLGFHTASTSLLNKNAFRLHYIPDKRKLLYFGVLSILMGIVITKVISIPVQFDKLISVIFSPDLGVALLALLYYRDEITRNEKIVVLISYSTLVFSGVLSGSTQGIVLPLVIWFVCRWLVVGGIPKWSVAAVISVAILVQPVKLQYRDVVWYGNEQSQVGVTDKAKIFTDTFINYWLGSATNENSSDAKDDSYTRRFSMLLSTSHILEWTPEVVPYQYGKSLSYFLYSPIPRFLWTNKPIAQQANIEYGSSYGISSPRALEKTRFSMGHIGEAFSNFGWLGIIPIFFVIGYLYYLPIYLVPLQISYGSVHDTFRSENIASLAVLISAMMNLMFIGSTIGNVFGAIIQQVVLQVILLYYFTRGGYQSHSPYT